MAQWQQLSFEAFPEAKLSLRLFKDVSNATDLRAQVVAGTMQPPCTLINAEAAAGVFAVHLAAHKSLLSQATGTLATKTLQTELIHNLSGSKHVAEGLRRFGVNEATKHVLVATFNTNPDQEQQLDALVQGTPVPLNQLHTLTDKALVRKYYKIPEREEQLGSLEDAVVCRIAAKEAKDD